MLLLKKFQAKLLTTTEAEWERNWQQQEWEQQWWCCGKRGRREIFAHTLKSTTACNAGSIWGKGRSMRGVRSVWGVRELVYSKGSKGCRSVWMCGARDNRQLVSGFVGQYFQLMCFVRPYKISSTHLHTLANTHSTHTAYTHINQGRHSLHSHRLLHYLMYLTFVVSAMLLP